MPPASSAMPYAKSISATASRFRQQGHEFNATLSWAARSRARSPGYSTLYSAGNFIESSRDTPYFQIGESKYGKPIIRPGSFPAGTPTRIACQAAKCALVSMDSDQFAPIYRSVHRWTLDWRRDEISHQDSRPHHIQPRRSLLTIRSPVVVSLRPCNRDCCAKSLAEARLRVGAIRSIATGKGPSVPACV